MRNRSEPTRPGSCLRIHKYRTKWLEVGHTPFHSELLSLRPGASSSSSRLYSAGIMEPQQSPIAQFPTSLPPSTLNTITATTILLAAAIAVLLLRRTDSKIPHANPPAWFSSVISVKIDAAKRGLEIYNDAKKRLPGRPFRMITNFGEVIVLPNRYANGIRNEEKLDFGEAIKNVRVHPWSSMDGARGLILDRTFKAISRASSLLRS